MILIIILALILAGILWIVFVPVNIIVNTAQHRYCVSQTGTVALSWHPQERPNVTIKVFGFIVNRQSKQKPTETKARVEKSKRPRTKKSLDAWIFLVKGILKSFKLRRFECTVDFDDVVLNAQLYPVFYLTNGVATRLSTNFRGECYLDILIQGRIYRMLWAALRFYLTKK